MKAMTYSGPDGTTVANPSLDFLEGIIFRERNRYWRVGSGNSELSVVEHKGKKHVALLPKEPALSFWLVERHGFFFIYFDKTKKHVEQFVPFAGGKCRPWVEHVICGDAFYSPRACFVSRAFAWEIVQEFLRSKERSRAVTWVNRFSLQFPNPAAGDEPVPKGDRA